jgi:hypothetical protein
MSSSQGLFKWHATAYYHHTAFPSIQPREIKFDGERCPWCACKTKYDRNEKFSLESASYYTDNKYHCPACGWCLDSSGWYNISAHVGEQRGHTGILERYELDDPQVTLAELGSYLKQSFADIHNISWRRFEELVADIFKKHGYRTRLTQATRDEGVDIILLDDESAKKAIVQAKRYRDDRKIGVAIVRELIGTQILHQVSKAYLVTSSSFSHMSEGVSQSPVLHNWGLDIELWDAMRLMRELDCYNEHVLPFDRFDPTRPVYEQIPLQDLGVGSPDTDSR